MYSRMLKAVLERTKVFKFFLVIYIKVWSRISFSGGSYRMEVNQLVCDDDLLTGSCMVLAFVASNFLTITISLLFSFIHHSLQIQDEIAL